MEEGGYTDVEEEPSSASKTASFHYNPIVSLADFEDFRTPSGAYER